jgi:hypothetical protein
VCCMAISCEDSDSVETEFSGVTCSQAMQLSSGTNQFAPGSGYKVPTAFCISYVNVWPL